MTRLGIRYVLGAFALVCGIGMSANFGMAGEYEGVPRIIYRNPVEMPGVNRLNVDVFWCDGDGLGEGRAIDASELAASYAATARVAFPEGAIFLGEIRSRSMLIEDMKRRLTSEELAIIIDNPMVKFDPADFRASEFVGRVIARGSRPSYVSRAGGFVPNYISVFTCPSFDPSIKRGRLFFQVQNESQKGAVAQINTRLKQSLPGLSIATAIEVVGARAPDKSEIRYFFPEDSALAAKVARDIGSTMSTVVEAKHIPGYEQRIRRGTLEAWISE